MQQGQGYPPFYTTLGAEPTSGHSQPYAQPVVQPQYDPQSSANQTTPFDDGRFEPKKQVNDILFLVLFILQVSLRYFLVHSF